MEVFVPQYFHYEGNKVWPFLPLELLKVDPPFVHAVGLGESAWWEMSENGVISLIKWRKNEETAK